MKLPPSSVVAAFARSRMLPFVMKVFATLHPGDPTLKPAWYLYAVCHALEEAWRTPGCRRAILVPPRHLKSITASVAWVAWMLGHDPSLKIMVASYSEELSRLHSGMTKTVMEAGWYKELFPGTRIAKRGNRALEFHTTAGGGRKAISVEGTITGFGADVIVVDDCMKAEDARSATKRQALRNWFDNTLLTRPNDKATARIVSIQQRLHEDDLPAYLFEKGYAALCLPAIAEKEELVPVGPGRTYHRLVGDLLDPGREGREVLGQLRRDLGPVAFAAQYQQDPVAPGGNLVRMEWFEAYHEAPERHEFLKVVQSWDTGMTAAPTSDYTAGTTWGFHASRRKWYLLDVVRQRLDFPDIRRAIATSWKHWGADLVLIEDAGSGKALWAEFRASGPFLPVMVRPDASKEDRFNGCLAEVEAGYFLLPAEAPWLDDFRAELRAFPYGKHDDQADSFSQFVNWQRARWKWVITERDKTGRQKEVVRARRRPW